MRIHDAGDPQSDADRYLVVPLPDEHHVQCKLHDHTRMIYCEAASGFYEAKEGAPRTAYLPNTAVAGLRASAPPTDDSKGNFSLDRAIGDSPDYRALADLILSALFVASTRAPYESQVTGERSEWIGIAGDDGEAGCGGDVALCGADGSTRDLRFGVSRGGRLETWKRPS